MDPITHAASGALTVLAIEKRKRPSSRMLFPFALGVAAFPDIDFFFGNSALDYLLLHRGITHSLLAAPIIALPLALIAFPLWAKSSILPLWMQRKVFPVGVPSSPAPDETNKFKWPAWLGTAMQASGKRTWTFRKVYLFTIFLLLLHIWLDCVTSYGTMILQPISDYRARLNGIFIVDLMLSIPIILALWHGGKARKYALAGFLWVFLYPGFCVGLNVFHESQIKQQLSMQQSQDKFGKLTQISVLPDVFSPFFWRVVYQTDKPYVATAPTEFTWPQAKSKIGNKFPQSQASVYQQGLSFLGKVNTPLMHYPALRQDIAKELYLISREARAFEDFMLMPIQENLAMPENGVEEYNIYDLRFSTMFMTLYEFFLETNDQNPTFLMQARRKNNKWTQMRLVLSGAKRDTGWQNLKQPIKPLWWQKLIGIKY